MASIICALQSARMKQIFGATRTFAVLQYQGLTVHQIYFLGLFVYRFGPYFVEPVIAGLDPKTSKPFIASLDLIGCPMVTEDFVINGTCAEQLYGMCEALWEPDMVSLLLFI